MNLSRTVLGQLVAGAWLVAALTASGPANALVGIPTQTTFTLTGTCDDCTLNANPLAELVLVDYVLGSVIEASHLVSLTFVGSNMAAPFTVTLTGAGGSDTFSPGLDQIGGSLGAGTAAADFHLIFGDGWGLVSRATSDVNGQNWYACSRNPNLSGGGTFGSCPLPQVHADVGSAQWTTTAVPEPATYALMALGLLGLAWRGRSAKR